MPLEAQFRSANIRRKVAARGSWGIVSQALNTLSNLALALVVAQQSSAAGFGAWSLGYVGYMVALNFNRSVASMPMMLADPDLTEPRRKQVKGCLSTAVAAGMVGSLIMFAIGFVSGAGSSVRLAAWAFACFLPALLAQDALRYVFFRRGEPRRAAMLDLVWILLQAVAFWLLISNQMDGIFSATMVWGAGALAGAALGVAALRVLPSYGALVTFIDEHLWVSLRLTADSILVALSTYVIPVIVAATSGLVAAGALRAGQTLMGGIGMLVLGLTPVITLEAMRALRSGMTELRILWLWTAAIGVMSTFYGAVLLFMPSSLGELLLGESWVGASAVLLPLVLQSLIRGPFTGAPLILRARRDLNALLRLRLLTCLPSVLCPSAGAVIAGSVGAAWGLLVGAAVVDLLCIRSVSARRMKALPGSHRELAEEVAPL